MNDLSDLSKPLKTWSHLARNRKKPSEYEVVSTNLLWSTDDEIPWALSAETPMNKWYLKYREGSPLQHPDWNAFRDPEQLIYRTYNIMQDGQEAYVDGLLNEYNENEHDKKLSKEWLNTLSINYTPARYPLHAIQMGSAYLVQMVPASTIENCAMFQTADQLRWLSRLAYRTKELSLSYPTLGFGVGERDCWENHPAWTGFRELMERVLVAYDWGEHFVALNLVAKPALDEVLVRELGRIARNSGDNLLGQLADAQILDSNRSRLWSDALINFICKNDKNTEFLRGWLDKWWPYGEAAIDSYCESLSGDSEPSKNAKNKIRSFHIKLGLKN